MYTRSLPSSECSGDFAWGSFLSQFKKSIALTVNIVCEVSCICFLKKYNLSVSGCLWFVLQEVARKTWPKFFMMIELTYPFALRQVTWLLVFSPLIFMLVLLAFQSLLHAYVNIKSFDKNISRKQVIFT